jgi:glycosyltransferase involved in cell wall biosynthesis
MKQSIAVIVPCLNEELYIARCLDSILENDYPNELLEVIIVDGMSTDKTREIIAGYKNRFKSIKTIDNIKKTKPAALNLGIKNSSPEVIARIDAHAVYSPTYFSQLISTLEETDADLVGAKRITSVSSSLWGKIITASIDHRFAAGNAHYRTSSDTHPKEVSSVFCGCYRRRAFQRVGLFNEALIRTQDRELNTRIKQSGGMIVLDPQTSCTYFARTDLWQYTKWVFHGAFWLFYASRFSPTCMKSLRNYIPCLFLLYLIIFLGLIITEVPNFLLMAAGIPLLLYCVISFFSAWQVTKYMGNFFYTPMVMLFFLWTHVIYATGSLLGSMSEKIMPKQQTTPPPL